MAFDGLVKQQYGNAPLSNARILLTNLQTGQQDTIWSNDQGQFRKIVPSNHRFQLKVERNGFKPQVRQWTAKPGEGQYEILLERLPGYQLEVSLFDLSLSKESPEWNTWGGATIEVYNNTSQQEELRLVDYPHPFFSVRLEQGNEYIFMIRRKGYYTKRMRANVNVNNCILCMEGFGTVSPGVTDNLTDKNTAGTLVTQVGMKKMVLNETVKIENIYYALGSAELQGEALKQLSTLVEMLRDNPSIVIELSSHTDCRGSSSDNLSLSQRRADNVVAYLKSRLKLDANRIKAKGYGETKPVNSCVDGIPCSEELHQQNRRTEFTIIDILAQDAQQDRSLASIMQEENLEALLSASEDTYFEEEKPKTQAGSPKMDFSPKAGQELNPPQVIPMRYTGYKIEVLRQKEAPTMDHPLLKAFAIVYLDMPKEGEYAFLIGEFKSREEAQNQILYLQKQYPNAKIAQYQEGLRKE
jgi:outer membrane protein OmpA-like peptidoglycan-associated protein